MYGVTFYMPAVPDNLFFANDHFSLKKSCPQVGLSDNHNTMYAKMPLHISHFHAQLGLPQVATTSVNKIRRIFFKCIITLLQNVPSSSTFPLLKSQVD